MRGKSLAVVYSVIQQGRKPWEVRRGHQVVVAEMSSTNGNIGIKMLVLPIGVHGRIGEGKQVLLLLGEEVPRTTNSGEQRKERLVVVGYIPIL